MTYQGTYRPEPLDILVDKAHNGWVLPNGEYKKCRPWQHDHIACDLGFHPLDIESVWVKLNLGTVSNGHELRCLTEQQRATLARLNVEVPFDHWAD